MNAHACLWCGLHGCTDRFDHERLWRGTDQYARLPIAQANACTACDANVNDGAPCVAVAPRRAVAA